MTRVVRWRNLIPGLVSLAAVLAIVTGIIFYGRIGALRGDTYSVYVFTNEARGILQNSDVWLEGKRIGIVDAIEFRPIATDTAKRIRLRLKILREHQALIRADSYAQIRSGGRLLGEPVVYITMGTDSSPALEAQAVLDSREQADAENIASEIALASRDFPMIAQNARRLIEQARVLAQRLDAVGTDEPGVAFRVVTRRAQRLTSAASDTGTVGLFLADSLALVARLRQIMARTDSLGTRLQETGHTFNRMSNDSTLSRQIADLRNEVSIVRALVTDARGTAGRLMFDQAIPSQLTRVESELGQLMADLRNNPARYLIH
jgi:ABC-type transporter Mla subunit MlaD